MRSEVVKTISDATARQVKGWLSPALAETFETPKILNELDLSYVVEAIGIAGR
jgi:allantoinase